MDPNPVTRRQFLGAAGVLAAAPLAASDPFLSDPSSDAAPPHFPTSQPVLDPLPPGVCRQFGSASFRDMQTAGGRFSADSRWLVWCDEPRCGGYEMTTGRRVGFRMVSDGDWRVQHWVVTTDHRLTVIEKNDDDYRVRRYDLPTGAAHPPLPVHGGQGQTISADGRIVVVEGEDAKGSACWGLDLTTGNTLWESRREQLVHPFEPTGRFASVGVFIDEPSAEFRLKLFHPATGRAVPLEPPAGESRYEVQRVWCTADGRLVAHVVSLKGEVRRLGTWDADSGRLVAAFEIGEREGVIGTTADGRGVFAVDGGSRQLVVRSLATGKLTRRYPVFDVYAGESVVTPDGKTLLLARRERGKETPVPTDNTMFRLIDADTGLPLPQSPDPPGPLTRVWFPSASTAAAAFRPQAGHLDYTLWDIPTGRGRRVIDPREKNEAVRSQPGGFRDPIEALSPDGRRLIWLEDGTVGVFDISAQKSVAKCDDLPSGLYRFWLDPKTVGVVNRSGLYLWEPNTGKTRTVPLKLSNRNESVVGCRPSADGRVVVFTNSEPTKAGVQFSVGWVDVGTGEMTTRKRNVPAPGGYPTVSADGERVATLMGQTYQATFMADEVVEEPTGEFVVHHRDGRRWEVRVPRALAQFDLSGCGRTLVVQSARTDKGLPAALELWEVATGTRRWESLLDRPVTDLRASPCGRYVATVRADTPLYLWDVFGEVSDPRPEPKPADLPRLWADLGWPEAERAFATVRTLVQHPDTAVKLLGSKLKPVEVPKPGWVQERIGRLNDRDFRTRDGAERELAAVADLIADTLRKAAEAGADTEEADERLERLVARADRPADWLRAVRGVEVLEYAAGDAAGELLRRLAGGVESAFLTREATAALRRRL